MIIFVAMKRIELSSRGTHKIFAQVDDEDYDLVSSIKWYLLKIRCGLKYAASYKNGKCVLMHRLINSTPEGLHTDHVDRDGLNNQKSNLRTCTRSQNMQNRRIKTGKKTSRYKGVYKHKSGRFKATITLGRKSIHLGYFERAKDAAKAYDDASNELFGEFAKNNRLSP